MRKVYAVIALMGILLLIVALSGCTQNTATPTPNPTSTPAPTTPAGAALLTIKGKVAKPLALSLDDLKKYESKTITVLGKDNVSVTYTGVPYNKLLSEAGPTADAKSALMVGSDGYSKALELANITASADAIIAINADNTLKAVIPGESKGAWVGNLTTIEIQ